MAAKKAVKKVRKMPEKAKDELARRKVRARKGSRPNTAERIYMDMGTAGLVEVGVAAEFAKEEDLRDNNVMSEALKIIYGDREKTYGHPSLNLESIAQLWTVYMKRKAYVELTRSPFADDSDLKQVELIVPKITIDDVCQMMVLLKMARLINDPTHHDSMVDQVGYIGLQERVQL